MQWPKENLDKMTNNEVQDTTQKTERLSNANTIKYRGCTHVLWKGMQFLFH